jgi:hypothetical protein
MTDLLFGSLRPSLGAPPSLDGPLREPSFTYAPLQVSTLLDLLGLRRCPGGCGSAVPKDGPGHSPEECAVAEVMSS